MGSTVTTPPVSGNPLLTVEDVAALLGGCSRRTIHEYTRRDAIPHRVLPGGRKCLFTEEDIRYWMDTGAELERIDLPNGGRVVRPKRSETRAA